MRTLLFVALPLAGLLAVDSVSFDYHAVKYTALMLGALLLLGLAALRGGARRTAISVPLLVFLAVRGSMLAGHAWSGHSFGREWRWWSLLLALTAWLHVAPSRAKLRRLAPALLGLAGGAIALIALAQWSMDAPQANGTMANRNFLAIALAMLIPFALSVRSRSNGPNPDGPVNWVLFALLVAGLVATKSRAGALAATASFTLWALWRRRFWMAPVLVLAPLAVLAAVLVFGRGAIKDRLHWYEAAWDMGKAHPVRGVGADGFRREYPPVRPRDEHAISGGRAVHAVHNDYLESFAEGGVPGLLAHLLLVAAAGWCVRRDRRAGPALLAFAVGSLVGLPLRDPALLALALFCVAVGVRRGAALPRAVPVLGGIAVLSFLPLQGAHWLGDRAFGEYLATGERGHLDRALARERLHPEALIERRSARDLELLVAMEPHHANAHYWRAKRLEDGPGKIAGLRRILLEHDPHHAATRLLLARLVQDDDPIQALSLIEGAIAADPRPWAPYVALARVHRENGTLEQAARALRKAEQRTRAPAVAKERVELSLATLRADGEMHPGALAGAVAHLPAASTRERVLTAFAAAEELARSFDGSRPDVPRREGEDDVAYIRRKREAEAPWQRRRQQAVHAIYLEAQLLADALTRAWPSAAHYRLRSRAARGLRQFEIARQLEALALFLEALNALAGGDEDGARRKLKRALRAHPELPREQNIRAVLKQWLTDHPARRVVAKRALNDAGFR